MVARVEVPPFETGFPPAIVWGQRFFLRVGNAADGQYIETFCYRATVEVIDKHDPRRARLNGQLGPNGSGDHE